MKGGQPCLCSGQLFGHAHPLLINQGLGRNDFPFYVSFKTRTDRCDPPTVCSDTYQRDLMPFVPFSTVSLLNYIQPFEPAESLSGIAFDSHTLCFIIPPLECTSTLETLLTNQCLEGARVFSISAATWEKWILGGGWSGLSQEY